ncbi:MAG: L,D-transpeptidase family protein [Wenzhouxiangellaceae bacterium]|nr:L,D-transpeptidase family protein [Wenzhouxiangellaceae bacterium]
MLIPTFPRPHRAARASFVAAVAVAALLAGLWPQHGRAVTWPLVDGEDVVGELISDRLRGDDSLIEMARMHNIGHVEIRLANPGLDPWLSYPGEVITVPQLHVLPEGPREGIVVNLSERRLYYFADTWPDRDGPVVSTHPVGVGLLERSTPVLKTKVTARVDNPAWYPTPGVRAWYRREKNEILPSVVPPGPENPLGKHALILAADGLLIHGTHRPAGVGMRVSQGCIRLYPEGIANLIRQVPVGTPVRVVEQPMRLGWRSGRLYLEVDPLENGDGETETRPESDWQELRERLDAAARARPGLTVDFERARRVFERADSIPVAITQPPAVAAGIRQENPPGD